MIAFICPGCGKSYRVGDELAGHSARCKTCATKFNIPSGSKPQPAAAPAVKLPVRTRRLISDAEQMSRAFVSFPTIRLRSTRGDPPEVYVLEYFIHGLQRPDEGAPEPSPRQQHLVEITLTSNYPRLGPKCRMLTPIFHPNIDPSTICVGDHWTAGERLVDLAVRIGEMIAFQSYNIKSPLDAEAAMWADLHRDRLPTDPRPLHPT